MKVGDMVKRLWHSQNHHHGIVIEKTIMDVITSWDKRYAYRLTVFYIDGRKEICWPHDLELVNESR